MALKTTGEWDLKSGSWASDSNVAGLEMQRSALGIAVSQDLTRDDIGTLMRAQRAKSNRHLHYPPEFRYCQVSGESLEAATLASASEAWVAPFGGMPVAPGAQSIALGLRQTNKPLRLARRNNYSADGVSDTNLPSPPPGDYNFFSANFGTVVPSLLCVDARKGTLRTWLPESKKWAELQPKAFLLDATALSAASWRAELAYAFNSRIYLGTQQGLACVTPDVPSLTYQVRYVGGAAAIAAPISFDGKIWSPLRNGDKIDVASIDLADNKGQPVSVGGIEHPGAASAPVSYGRLAIWPFENGQLRLNKQADGTVVATWIGWPDGVKPEFAFGSPYLSRDGAFWQLCFNSNTSEYLYIQLGSEAFETAPVQAPRFCSGSVNYRFAVKMKEDPWVEPESGDDVSSNFIIPLIESAADSVIGLKIESNTGLSEVLSSEQRLRAVLVLEDNTNQIAFHTIAAVQPWRTRIFCHEGVLWVYHPTLNRIDGWNLLA